MENIKIKHTPQDFKSDQEVRWCPGCGDHAILNSVQKAMAESGVPREDFAIISGIGCSSRFPYYMNNFGFHSIHGRAAAIASGVKCANPKLKVIQVSGDGDALAIGGNHFIHLVRRNIDLSLLLFNNEIYGLTKGQYSPTTKYGFVTKSSPYGTIEQPFQPGAVVIGSQGKFFARALDTNLKHQTEVILESIQFKGTAVVEILQNCVIFNDKTFADITDKEERENRQIYLEHGKPMIFGKNKDKGIVLEGFGLKVVTIGENGVKESDLLVHDKLEEKPFVHQMLIDMKYPDFPVAFGVIRAVKAPVYDDLMEEQIEMVKSRESIKSVKDLLFSGNTWEIE